MFFQIDKKIWENCCREDLTNVSDTLRCWLSINVLRCDFLGIKATALFAVYNFGNKRAMRLIVFPKYSTFDVHFRNFEENSANVFCYGDNCVWIGCVKHSLLPREYLSLGVDKLSNSLKIWDTTKTKILELKLFQSDRNIWQNYCREDFCSFSNTLTCWLAVSVLTQGFLGI